MATKGNENHQGSVKDPEHDGRLKENREAGQTKGTTPASAARAKSGGHEAEGSHAQEKSGSHSSHGQDKGGSHASHNTSHTSGKAQAASHSGSEDDDMKSREYTDAQGNVHHHTKAYMESHAKK